MAFRAAKVAVTRLRFNLWNWYQAGAARASLARSRAAELGDREQQQEVKYQNQRAHCDKIRSLLRTTPYWRSGHVLLSRIALELDDIATAYASVRAAEDLKPRENELLDIQLVLGKCYLRRGLPERGAEVLEKALLMFADQTVLKEELAACYLAMGRTSDAESMLASVPQEELSPAGNAVRGHLVSTEK